MSLPRPTYEKLGLPTQPSRESTSSDSTHLMPSASPHLDASNHPVRAPRATLHILCQVLPPLRRIEVPAAQQQALPLAMPCLCRDRRMKSWAFHHGRPVKAPPSDSTHLMPSASPPSTHRSASGSAASTATSDAMSLPRPTYEKQGLPPRSSRESPPSDSTHLMPSASPTSTH
ncbi:hypothetical protein MRX96_005822 [Rhipicephalus microplus]